jgi:Zn-dependent M28 family amino/carboxypeptidase
MKNAEISRGAIIVLGLIAVALITVGAAIQVIGRKGQATLEFNGQRALEDVQYQVALGDRIPGNPGHARVVDWIQNELEKAGWSAEIQSSTLMDHPILNIVGKQKGSQATDRPWVILGAHYDTRMYADQDPDPQRSKQYVPGADDGASGVAVLLGLARSLPRHLPVQVWLVFFDAEDNGGIPGWDWLLGSKAFVASLTGKPDAAVVVDMVGDKDLNIYLEKNSNQAIARSIWAEAAKAGYKQFIPVPNHSMIDDHTPFLQAGIPAVDIIDFDYPYWHTTADTPDKVSGESLKAVGDTLIKWLDSGQIP